MKTSMATVMIVPSKTRRKSSRWSLFKLAPPERCSDSKPRLPDLPIAKMEQCELR
jgi:hypothetical protein